MLLVRQGTATTPVAGAAVSASPTPPAPRWVPAARTGGGPPRPRVGPQRAAWRRAGATLLLLTGLLLLLITPARADDTPVTLLYFGTETCPFCERMEDFLDELEAVHGDALTVERFEVAQPTARQRWQEEMAARGHQASGVPTVIVGDRVWVGYDGAITAAIERTVEDAVERAAAPTPPDDPAEPGPPAPDLAPDDARSLEVPLLGEVRLDQRSPLAATTLIAFVDGFNPCSLWVLTVLIAMVLNAGGSRARLAAVGGTFLAVTGLLYGAFIVGIFTVMGLLEHLTGIRVLVAAIALVVGAINVKDYIAYKRGPSLTIPDRFKPRIYRAGRAVRDPRRSLLGVLGLTVVMAAGISLVELPCTAGFPVIWTGMVRTQGIEGVGFAGLLLTYVGIYVLVEIVILAVALVTLQISSFQETHGRVLKLVGGAVMLALAVVLVAAPQLMESMAGAMLVVLGSVALALGIAAVHRWVGGGGPGAGGGPGTDSGPGGGRGTGAARGLSAGRRGRARARPRR